jgi:hypothetical protein
MGCRNYGLSASPILIQMGIGSPTASRFFFLMVQIKRNKKVKLAPPDAKVLLFGHHRSGNHYLAALINTNFFGESPDYKFLVNGRQHTLIRGLAGNAKFLYIHRNFEDVSKSCFEMRSRFGLDVDTYEDFISQPYCDMFTGKIAVNLRVNFIYKEFNDRSSSIFFRNIKRTPKEWHDAHLEHYTSLAERVPDKLLLVSYDRLKEDFHGQMLEIAQFFGTRHRKFQNIDQKVGYWVNN